ncbi:hypothetical protein [Rubellicoccus peritrichatus]|uniref:HTH gntR-type domain-containing protein n=1 Tax=Rubellicoccus peritrichatus TaxID=3080537 RepID=A0AAQ3QS34_9BACT|nr:hypothetical protein [Puniceicoccus sp. CR14]WOO39931.1 hypothetical protein RZN69_14995 [Puniceicoccus sp. CR14]
MAKKRTKRVAQIKETLIHKIKNERGRAGNFFLSNRELSTRYGVSYLTAHRLISELCDENYLHRAPRSGTYIAAESVWPNRIVLIFNFRGNTPNSFADQLLRKFQKRCKEEAIQCDIQWADDFDEYPEGGFPIVWGIDYNLREFLSSIHYGILLNERANAGISSTFTDSILIDNYSGGMIAAQIANSLPRKSGVLVLAGPQNGITVQERLNGVKKLIQEPRVIHLDGWQLEHARRGISEIDLEGVGAVVCLHDSAADAFHERFGNTLPVIRFGDKTLAKAQGDACVVIPWDKIVEQCIGIFKTRAQGESKAGQRYVFPTKIAGYQTWQKHWEAGDLQEVECDATMT